jgi:hypothetical protein
MLERQAKAQGHEDRAAKRIHRAPERGPEEEVARAVDPPGDEAEPQDSLDEVDRGDFASTASPGDRNCGSSAR